MKSINKFDYPQREITSNYKNYQQTNCMTDNDKKIRYKQNLQYHMQIQRNKVQENQRKRQSLQCKRNKEKINKQLEKKKKQLESLQSLKKQAQEHQIKARQLAIQKQQKDKLKKQQDERKKKQFDLNANNRFQQALKRLHQQKDQQSFKQRLAEQRRRTNQQFEKIQRIKANKYKAYLQQKQKNKQQEDIISFQQYKKTLGRSAYNKNTDYTKSCIHNPKIIVQNLKKYKQQDDAYHKGKQVIDIQKQKSQDRRKKIQQNMRISQERGKLALLKMQRQKEYNEFQRQSEQQQKKYNFQRIQAGKKNQYIGIKPTTLQQMEQNKKLRSQEQFDKMFFNKPLTMTQNFNKSANKFDIVDGRMPKNNSNSFTSQPKSLKQNRNPYLKEKQQSQIPCVSDGKYSFEEPDYQQFEQQKSHSKSHHQINEEDPNNEQQISQNSGYNVKNAWKQTGIPNQKYKNSPNNSRKVVNPFTKNEQIKNNEYSNEQKISFNTDQMLKKYGLKKDSPNKKKKVNQNSQQKKRKVVQLANICQNKDNSKQQLSYSQSQQQQDSLN